jgi:hypothetical protein
MRITSSFYIILLPRTGSTMLTEVVCADHDQLHAPVGRSTERSCWVLIPNSVPLPMPGQAGEQGIRLASRPGP